MRRYLSVFILVAAVTGCGKEGKVVIRGNFTSGKEGMVYLEHSQVDKITIIDSASLKKGSFTFKTNIDGPEFYQVGVSRNDFVSLLARPGEKISLTLGNEPLVMNSSVTGSPWSEQVQLLDKRLFITKIRLDSLRNIYGNLSQEEIPIKGPELEQAYIDAINSQRKSNIEFILKNPSSMAAIKAVYQRIDENTYVLYQPRDLQFLKIVSDTLSLKYPASKHVQALTDNLNSEVNQMYMDRLANIAAQVPSEIIDPDLLNTEDKRISLSSLKGKYVLVSFWSGTSEESVAELTALKNIYKLYSKKGLEIYQISLDPDINRWKSMVVYEEIPWISVREDDPENPFYARTYNISGIPSNILYDREGNVINKDLFGRNLLIKMDQLFNK